MTTWINQFKNDSGFYEPHLEADVDLNCGISDGGNHNYEKLELHKRSVQRDSAELVPYITSFSDGYSTKLHMVGSPAPSSFEQIHEKWDKMLYWWWIGSGQQQPRNADLLCLHGIVGASEGAIIDWFAHLTATGNIPRRTLTGKTSSSNVSSYASVGLLGTASSVDSREMAVPILADQDPATSIVYQDLADHCRATEARLEINPSQEDQTMEANARRQSPASGSEVEITQVSQIGTSNANPALSASLRNVIEAELERRRRLGCAPIRKHENKHGPFQCTTGCGRRFKDAHDWTRHEETSQPQKFWFCNQCGDVNNVSIDLLFTRRDKFVSHLRKCHSGSNPALVLAQSRVPYAAPCKK